MSAAMPARTESAAAPATGAPAPKRFELPALDFNFKSLTDGTNIPAPLPSPVREEPPSKPAVSAAAPASVAEEETKASSVGAVAEAPQINGASSKINGHHTTPSTITTITSGGATAAGVKRPLEDLPASPTASNRPGSIRRLFSRNLLNSAYANGEQQGSNKTYDDTASSIGGGTRPGSRSNGSFVDGKRTKRSSGWFSRFRSSGDTSAPKRTSMVSNENKPPTTSAPVGPPPPMIPELDELKAKVDLKDDGSLGDDLFKNIK